ncbi:hypothetical protein J4E85_006415 [Alternaria conjuncta]|uniref:uncharacterized protein n=1 Tax=Alternaria conjuncta TaxID=181017 RepID=UPI0022203127|nr:uncharacterized protein J4E85_006415 [Alternaria conjuncta]KAI4927902.1 hypothetical protein J4E85_006415 [Alternaria conjuncta]
MNEPPAKRRRTSSPTEQASSPLRKPPRRPSFASPTKASLARNYPNLLSASPKRNPNRPVAARNGSTGREETEVELPSESDLPELPGTPPQNIRTTSKQPRRTMIFSSPSKRPSRVRDPIKQPPPSSRAPAVQSDDFTGTVEDGPVEDITEEMTQEVVQKRQRPDPEIERRKQEKARLQREVEELESQVSRCIEEVVKEQRRGPEDPLRSPERDSLKKFISDISSTDTEPEKPATVSSLLCSFLPFAALSVPRPRPKQEEKPVPSHRPVELADPLPYLQMFTSLNFSTQLSLPRGKISPTSRRVHQKHTIDIAGPQKLLTAQVSITIDALASEIIEMQLLRISTWAERELGTFMRSKAQERDLGNASWAMDSYWEIAKKRAQHWHKCETAFAHLLVGQTAEDTENAQRLQPGKPATTVTRKDLSRNLGRDTLVLQDKHVLLKLNWQISFDWTGEAESDVSVEAAFPQVWSETEHGGVAFKKIPQTFASLVRTRGAFQATKIMVALLFSQ